MRKLMATTAFCIYLGMTVRGDDGGFILEDATAPMMPESSIVLGEIDFLSSVLTAAPILEGRFLFSNVTAPTRIGSVDGPVAGPGIWAQMFAGLTPETLSPLGMPAEHGSYGVILLGALTVPGSDQFGTAYAQMFTWDGQMWGNEFDNVPSEWLGSTGIVPVRLAIGEGFGPPIGPPPFTQPAIVPVPEPSTVVLAVFGALIMLALQRSGRRTRHA